MLKNILLSIILIASVVSSAFIFKAGDSGANSNESYVQMSLNQEKCGTTEYMEWLKKNDNSYAKFLEELEKFTQQYIKEHGSEIKRGTVVTIPTVVHVVWNTSTQNISDDQIYSQIDVLSEDFRRWNLDTANTPAPFKPLGADAEVQFVLAKRDPNNNPSIGITRTQTTVSSFGTNNAVKFTASGGHDAWDRDKYLNVWTCNLSSGLLGYAQFPGGPAATDGVVVGYNYFGRIGTLSPPFNKGRTATHEVGHWLWLYHIWGDDNGACFGTDQVEDTPNQGSEFYGCPSFPQLDACTPNSPGVMFMNYMDYTDDGCMNIFTMGQSVRMQSALTGPRLPITTSTGGDPVSGTPICAFRADSLSILYGQPVHFYDLSAGIPTGWQWTFTGGNPPSSTQQNPTVSYSTPGLYTVKLRVSNSSGNDSLTKVNYIRVRGAAMSPFNIVSPPSFTRVTVSATDTSKVHFIWTKSSANPSVTYKMKIRKIATQTDYLFTSNSSGLDSVVSIRKSTLDSLAEVMGTTGDSVRCTWRTWAYNGIDSLQSANSFIVTLVRSTIGIQIISTEVPGQFALYNNYPNPFNPVTKIKFDIPGNINNESVKLVVYDILGREAAILVNQNLKAGRYETDWDAADYPSGIYFYSISAGDFKQTRKMVLIK